MFVKLVSTLLICVTLSGCGKYNFEEIYRYPCQDPANWESEDCKPPKCEAWGGCTKDVLKGTPLYDEDIEQQVETTNE
jgi:hypothetical protein